jgi:lipopolysaccharide/colanic/teichoic acid biosynthesis glycosyltransferase
MFEHDSAIETVPVHFPIPSRDVVAVAVEERPVTARLDSVKRAMDVALALIGLVLAAPLLIVAIGLICASSPGSPVFAQSRIGRHGKPFMMYKLRTMSSKAASKRESLHLLYDTSMTGPVIKVQHDPRVFPLGRFLRKTSIDELPNLVNVLIGDMSIVGPRPMQAIEIEYCALRYGEDVNASRLAVNPGITCLWQISGRSRVPFDERVRLDVTYAATWNPLEDLRIIVATIPAVMFSRGAY